MLRSVDGQSPQVHPSAYVNEAAYVVGDVTIGAESSVWPSAVVRGDDAPIVIGRATNIQDCAVVHAEEDASIGDYVTIGHGAVIHGLKIGDHCLIGNNATVLDGAELGDHCIVAAGAVVPPNTKAPANSLLSGVPAKVRSLEPHHHELIQHSWEIYRQKAQRYKAAGL